MSNVQRAEHYLGLTRQQILTTCRQRIDEALSGSTQKFERLSNLLTAWFHHAYHKDLELLKQEYTNQPAEFANTLAQVVEAANFSRISSADINQALAEESMFRLRLAVNFDDFEEIVFYARGQSTQQGDIARWFGLKKQTISFTNYEHVLIYLRFKAATHFAEPDELSFEPGSSMLKVFENVPRADLEMLFPNTEVRMRLMDKIFIGVPALVSGFIVLTTKVGATLLILGSVFAFWLGLSDRKVVIDQTGLIALVTGAGALGGYLWKQYSSFKNRKIRFMKALAENLYFKTLACDDAVLGLLIDHAEESETKEVLLAYTELLINGPMTKVQLQENITNQLHRTSEYSVLFDIDDALKKLIELELVIANAGLVTAKSLDEALELLTRLWDRQF